MTQTNTLILGTLPSNETLPIGMRTYKVASLWRDELKAWFEIRNGCKLPKSCTLILLHEDVSDSYEVVAWWDSPAGQNAAFWLEGNAPAKWSYERQQAYKDIVDLLT